MITSFSKRAFLVLGLISVIGGNLGAMHGDEQNQCTALVPYQDPKLVIEKSIERHQSRLMRNALAEAYSSEGLANQCIKKYKNKKRLDEARSAVFKNPDFFEEFLTILIDNIDISDPRSFFEKIQIIVALGSINKPYRDVFKQKINKNVGPQKQSINTLLFVMKKLGISERDLLEAFGLTDDDIDYIEDRLLVVGEDRQSVVGSRLSYNGISGWVRHDILGWERRELSLNFLDVICLLAKIYGSNLEKTIEILRADSHVFFLHCLSLPSFARLIDKSIQEKINSTHFETLRHCLENCNLLIKLCEEECYELLPSLLFGFRKMYHYRPDFLLNWRRELTQLGEEGETLLRLVCSSGDDEIIQLLIKDLKKVYVNDLASLRKILEDTLAFIEDRLAINTIEDEIQLLNEEIAQN